MELKPGKSRLTRAEEEFSKLPADLLSNLWRVGWRKADRRELTEIAWGARVSRRDRKSGRAVKGKTRTLCGNTCWNGERGRGRAGEGKGGVGGVEMGRQRSTDKKQN